MAVATIANLTQQSRTRPYEDTVPDSAADISCPTIAAVDNTSDSEGVLVIDLQREEDSDPSQYSDDSNATVAYAEQNAE